MRKTSGLIISFLLIHSAFAQSNSADIKSQKKAAPAASAQVSRDANTATASDLITSANSVAISNPEQAMELATQALSKIFSAKDKLSEGRAYNTLGTLYYNSGNFEKASEYFGKAQSTLEKTGDEKSLGYAGKYLSLSLEKQKKFDEAAKVESITISKAPKANVSKKELASSKVREAKLKGKAGRKEEAISELEELEKDQTLPPEVKADINNELGELYFRAADTVKAIDAMNKSLALTYKWSFGDGNVPTDSDRDGIADKADPAVSGTYGYSTPQNFKIELNNKLSTAYLAANKIDENLNLQEKLLSEGMQQNDLGLIQSASYNLGNTWLAAGKAMNAITYFNAAARYAAITGNPAEEGNSVRELSRAYENLGQYQKALQAYKRYVSVLDSLKEEELKTRTGNIRLNSQFLQQEQRIKDLEVQQKAREDHIRRQRNIMWSLTGGLLALGILIWLLVRNIRQKQKANMLIRLQSLRTQMNPHFIFNSLNSVNSFIAAHDEKSANKYLADFSKLMREVLRNSDRNFIPLEEEIRNLRIYLQLEHFRFTDKFDYSLEVDENVDLQHIQIPPMLIQPYIENSVWHGLRYLEGKGELKVRFYQKGDQLLCSISDNGIGRKKSQELKTTHQREYQSTGIRNTKERIAILNKLHGTRLDVRIHDLENNGVAAGTTVEIALPYETEVIEA